MDQNAPFIQIVGTPGLSSEGSPGKDVLSQLLFLAKRYELAHAAVCFLECIEVDDIDHMDDSCNPVLWLAANGALTTAITQLHAIANGRSKKELTLRKIADRVVKEDKSFDSQLLEVELGISEFDRLQRLRHKRVAHIEGTEEAKSHEFELDRELTATLRSCSNAIANCIRHLGKSQKALITTQNTSHEILSKSIRLLTN